MRVLVISVYIHCYCIIVREVRRYQLDLCHTMMVYGIVFVGYHQVCILSKPHAVSGDSLGLHLDYQ